MPSKLEQAQAKRVKQVRGRSPGRVFSAAESRRRAADPGMRDRQEEIGRSANKAQAERYQKTASRAMKKDMDIAKKARTAANTASNRVMRAAAKGAGRMLGAVPAAALTGAEMVEAVVDPMAEKTKAERESYNERAGTNRTTSRRSTRQAMDNTRLDRLRARDMTGVEMKKGGKVRGCGMAQRGKGKARMIKMKGA